MDAKKLDAAFAANLRAKRRVDLCWKKLAEQGKADVLKSRVRDARARVLARYEVRVAKSEERKAARKAKAEEKKAKALARAEEKKAKAATPEARAKAAETQRCNRLKKYGLTPECYRRMLFAQGGRCAVCLSDRPGPIGKGSFAVDHDHVTGKIRGLLCGPCNVALGLFRDDPAVIRRGATYVELHAEAAKAGLRQPPESTSTRVPT